MHKQLWGYKVEEKLYLGVREQKRLNTAGLARSLDPTLTTKPLVPTQNSSLILKMYVFFNTKTTI
jgi:hypothetical protein